jgi:hypothetical protein
MPPFGMWRGVASKNGRFRETYRLHQRGVKNQRARNKVISNRSLILFTIMVEAIRSIDTSILIRDTWRHIPEGGILQKIVSLKLISIIKAIK